MSINSVPLYEWKLRACLSCSMIKEYVQFESDGCDNCPFLGLKNNPSRILQCTSSRFDGMIGSISPEDSWVARYQHIDDKAVGVYAISVSGELPPRFIKKMKDRGIPYISRDTSK